MDNPHPWSGESWLGLIESLLDRLAGRMHVIQTFPERQRLAEEALSSLEAEGRVGSLQSALADPLRRQSFLTAFLSYDQIEPLLADPLVEDIMINGTGPIFVHKAGQGAVKTGLHVDSEQALRTFVKKLLVFGGRPRLEPIMDLELVDLRGRANIVQSPFGPQITLTRARPAPWTILQLIEQQTISHRLAAQLWLYVEGMRIRPANLLIAGGSGAGKTTLMNALLSFIPREDRLVTIEDTLELNTSFLEHCSRLETTDDLSMASLVKNSLRMRPDRVLVGEVRGSEAQDLMTAMNIGKYCMGTLHASFARETVLRLEHEPMNVPSILINLVDVFVILRRLEVNGKVRRVVAEIAETAGMERDIVLLSPVWTYDHMWREVVESAPSSVFRDKLAAESGCTAAQIMKETSQRAEILARMQESGHFTDINTVTVFCQRYSEHPEEAIAELKSLKKKK